MHGRKSPDFLEEIVDGNVNSEDISGEVSNGDEEHVVGNWRKGNPFYKMAENLGEL